MALGTRSVRQCGPLAHETGRAEHMNAQCVSTTFGAKIDAHVVWSATCAKNERQGRSIIQPRVARNELPWVTIQKEHQP